jgi:hypothetical protein
VKFRYMKDFEPAFIAEQTSEASSEGMYGLRIATAAESPDYWAYDENQEVYQVVEQSPGSSPLLFADYYLEASPDNGGGFIRVTALSETDLQFIMMFKWSHGEYNAINLPRGISAEFLGYAEHYGYLQSIGAEYKGMYFDIDETPLTWHSLSVNLRELYDRAHMRDGAFDELSIDRLVIGLSTWVNRPAGSYSAAYFDNIELTEDAGDERSTVDGVEIPCDGGEFQTEFGGVICDSRGYGIVDETPPLPEKATWRAAPQEHPENEAVFMEAERAVDPHGVEYYFEETSGNPGGDDSGWQDSPFYVDAQLERGYTYSYRVRTRDKWEVANAGVWSDQLSVSLQ